jgi:protein CpxP
MVSRVFTAAALALMVGTGATGAVTWAALAQTAAPAAPAPAPRPSHIEGRIAFLRTELKITDAQAAQWAAVADALRQNDQTMRALFQQTHDARDKPASVIERLELQERFTEARADATKRLLAAYRPLDTVLTPEQKQAAAELMARHMHGHHHR